MTGPMYAAQARTRKALALYHTAQRDGVTAAQVAESAEVRDALVRAARVRPPSKETWAMVVTFLEDDERKDG